MPRQYATDEYKALTPEGRAAAREHKKDVAKRHSEGGGSDKKRKTRTSTQRGQSAEPKQRRQRRR